MRTSNLCVSANNNESRINIFLYEIYEIEHDNRFIKSIVCAHACLYKKNQKHNNCIQVEQIKKKN